MQVSRESFSRDSRWHQDIDRKENLNVRWKEYDETWIDELIDSDIEPRSHVDHSEKGTFFLNLIFQSHHLRWNSSYAKLPINFNKIRIKTVHLMIFFSAAKDHSGNESTSPEIDPRISPSPAKNQAGS